MKIILITQNRDAMIGMRLAGVETARVKTAQQAEFEIQKAIDSDDTGIILITSDIEKLCPDTVFRLKQLNRPLLATIPDGDGNGRNSIAITDYIRDAIGIKI